MAEWLRHETRDPLDTLIAREERTCKGCIHRIVVFNTEACNKGRKPKRCKHYRSETSTPPSPGLTE